MDVSYWLPNSSPWKSTVEAARAAASFGCSGIWLADHFMPNASSDLDEPFHEAFTLLAGLAVAVQNVQIGTMVVGNTYRHPAVLAKQAVGIDHISGGRFVLGIGAGWQENEHVAYGLDYRTFRWRFDRLEESLQVISSLLANTRTDFSGEHFRLTDAPLEPKPVSGTLPILIGGRGPNRTLPLVARYADAWNMWGTPEMMAESGSVLDARCEQLGRDPLEIHRTAAALVFVETDSDRRRTLRSLDLGRPTLVAGPDEMIEVMAEYRKAGVAELVVPGHAYSTAGERDHHLGAVLEAAAGLG